MTDVVVDLGALAHNIRRVADRIAPATLMAVVKSDAYGHGAIEVAETAIDNGITWLGVLDAETGIVLRNHGIGADITMFAWLFSPDEDFARLIDADIDLGISSVRQLDDIEASGAVGTARLHLEIDTGLHRNGSTAEQWPHFVKRARELQTDGVVDIVGAWTHIAEASDEEDSRAIARFDAALDVAVSLGVDIRLRHLAASAAGYGRADARFDLVRSGAFLYGIAPGGGTGPAEVGIEPVMTLRGSIEWMRPEDGRLLAQIDTGWLDGVPAHAAGRVSVAIRGMLHEICEVTATGVVCEIANSAGSANVAVGDTATFFGPGSSGEQTLQEWADALETIGEEIVLGVPQRLQRRYLPDESTPEPQRAEEP